MITALTPDAKFLRDRTTSFSYRPIYIQNHHVVVSRLTHQMAGLYSDHIDIFDLLLLSIDVRNKRIVIFHESVNNNRTMRSGNCIHQIVDVKLYTKATTRLYPGTSSSDTMVHSIELRKFPS